MEKGEVIKAKITKSREITSKLILSIYIYFIVVMHTNHFSFITINEFCHIKAYLIKKKKDSTYKNIYTSLSKNCYSIFEK